MKQIPWIDVFKGIAILVVVVAHCSPDSLVKYLLWIPLPPFFFLSGYLYKPEVSFKVFLKKKTLRLLVPYAAFLILLGLPKVIFFLKEEPAAGAIDVIQLIGLLFYGGKELGGIFATFWFISCLFFTQQLYHFLYLKTFSKKWLFYGSLVLLYVLATLNSGYYALSFPWNINVVALSIFYFYFGHLARKLEPIPRGVKAVFLLFIFPALALDLSGIISFEFDMRYSFYGYPVFNLAVGVSFSLWFQELSKWISRFGPGQKILSEMGRASLVIMFLHLAVIKGIKDVFHFNSAVLLVILGLIIPYILYRVFRLYPLTRKLFLGDFSKELFN